MAVKSAERVLRIFEHLSGFPNGLTAKEISSQLGFAGSSTHELLKTLSENDYLIEDENKHFILGPKLIQLGHNAECYYDINKIATPYLKQIMQKIDETVFMAILSKNEIVYVSKQNSNTTVATNANIGSRKPIYCTGLGKAFLSFMPEAESEKILASLEYKQFTSLTVKNSEEMREQIKCFRKLGYAIDDGEIEEGLYCIAVPVYEQNYKLAVCISVSGLKSRIISKKAKIVETLLQVSNTISAKLDANYHGNPYSENR